MSSEPIRPFQDARELLKPRLAAAARGDADQLGKMALTYRVSGGPPGKRLFMELRLSAKGKVTYEHRDELHGKKTIRRKMILPEDQTISLLRQVHESGMLDLRDTGGGFLPDSTIAAIVIESDGSQVSYYFLAEEHQQTIRCHGVVFDRHEKTVFAVGDGFRVATHARDHCRHTASHCFQQGVAETFTARKQTERVTHLE